MINLSYFFATNYYLINDKTQYSEDYLFTIMINFVLTPDWVEAILGTIEGLSFVCSSLIVLRFIIVTLSIANFFFCYWVGLETAEHVSILLLAIINNHS